MVDRINQEVTIGDSMIFSAGKTVEIYEILNIRPNNRNSRGMKYMLMLVLLKNGNLHAMELNLI